MFLASIARVVWLRDQLIGKKILPKILILISKGEVKTVKNKGRGGKSPSFHNFGSGMVGRASDFGFFELLIGRP
jgi:hypothetical protein